MKRLLSIALLALACTATAEIIPQSRRITWDPGVRGGIPIRSTIFTNLTSSATAAQINNAMNVTPSNQVVKLGSGTYSINATLIIPTGVTLRGNGMSNTVLVGASGFSGNSFITWDNGFDDNYSQPARNITSGNTKGSTNLTTSVAHGWTAGDYILVDMEEQPSGDPPINNQGTLGTCLWCGRTATRVFGQSIKILTTPTTTTATFDPPFYWSYANTPQGVEKAGLTHFAGVEDLTVDNTTSDAFDTVTSFGGVNCWLYNCKFQGHVRRFLWAYDGMWNTIQKCWIEGGNPIGTDFTSAYRSDRAYGPFLGRWNASLITDSIFEKLTMAVAFEGIASGNVYSYNFSTNIWWETIGGDPNDAPRRFGELMHGPHPFMNLQESNYNSDRSRADEYWGTSSHFVFLRDVIQQRDRGVSDSQMWTVDVERGNWYWSYVGCLLGGSATVSENNYEYINGESAPYADSVSTIWKIGYNSLGDDGTQYDTGTLTNMIRWGNWSFRTNDSTAGSGQLFLHTNGVVDVNDRVIPNSYYLAAAPAFFTSDTHDGSAVVLTWPPFDPANGASRTNWFPAKLRYHGGTNATNYVLASSNAPLITSSTNQIATNYQTFSYQITTDISVDNYGATNLPSGLTVGNTTGLIQGTISIANTTVTNDVGLFATNSAGVGHTNMALKIVALAAPVINSATTADGTNGVAFTYQITGTQYPTNFGASGLPTGLSANLTSGLISGTPSQDGTFMVTLAATNGIGSDTETLTLEIDPPAPVLQVTPSSLSFSEIAETQTNTLTFSVTNMGGASSLLTCNWHSVSAPFYTPVPTNAVLAGGTGTNFNVRYAPTSKGTNTSSVVVQSNAGNVTNAVTGVCYPLASSWVDIPMTNALIGQPFVIHASNYIFQTNGSSAIDGGRAVYGFTVTNAGTFTFAGKTESADLGTDSMYFQLDGDPVDPDHNWAWVGPTSFTTNKVVTWPPYPNVIAQEFTLQPGIHKFVLRGREGDAHLRTITVTQTSGGPGAAPYNLKVTGAVTGSGRLTGQ